MATMVEATSRGQTTATATPTAWYRDKWRLTGAAVLTVLLLGVVVWLVLASGRRKEEFAARSLNQARATAEAGNLPLASSELQRLIETYRGTDAATEAVITLNQVRMVNGQSELAAVGLRDFLAKKPPQKYLAPAYGLLGTALENSQAAGRSADGLRQRLEGGRPGLSAGSVSDRRRPGDRSAGKTPRPRRPTARSSRSIRRARASPKPRSGWPS